MCILKGGRAIGKLKSNKTPQFLKVRPSSVDRIPDEAEDLNLGLNMDVPEGQMLEFDKGKQFTYLENPSGQVQRQLAGPLRKYVKWL